ncbi:MAG: SIMPL domain-containing protein [Lachnospiraceae bacterium]|jgi:uncharacterized protein YggE|nr:SIMPL domain-containing protein [Lachnospiraceae bacterium]
MKKQVVIPILTLITSAALTACTSPQAAHDLGASLGASMPTSIKIEDTSSQVITVSSSQEVYVVPDIAQLVFCVSTKAATAQECQQLNSKSLDQVLEYLKSQGISEESIQTSDYNLEPNYDWNNGRTIIDYEMSARVTVSQIPIDQVGELITSTVKQGANRVESVSYLSSQYEQSYQEALKRAVDSAREKAQVLAEAGGCNLGPVIHINESMPDTSARAMQSYTNYSAARDMATAKEEDMAVMPGQLKIQAQITVDFAVAH